MSLKSILVLTIASAFGLASAQSFPFGHLDRNEEGAVELTGTITHSPGMLVGNLTIEMSDIGGHGYSMRTVVSADGEFEFSSVPPGSYMLKVLTVNGTEITDQFVDVRDGYSSVQIRLPEPKGAKPGTGTVSVAQLLHRVPNKAMNEYQKGLRLFAKHDLEGGLAHLEKAVEIDPEFVEAQTDLGRAYIQKHQPEKVIAAFQQVLKVNPRSEVAYSGCSVAYLWQKKFQQAEESARRALDINAGSMPANFFLGISLAAQEKDKAAAIEHLVKSEPAFPNAHIAAAGLLSETGDDKAVTAELNAYLKSGDTAHRDEVKSWLGKMKNGQKSVATR